MKSRNLVFGILMLFIIITTTLNVSAAPPGMQTISGYRVSATWKNVGEWSSVDVFLSETKTTTTEAIIIKCDYSYNCTFNKISTKRDILKIDESLTKATVDFDGLHIIFKGYGSIIKTDSSKDLLPFKDTTKSRNSIVTGTLNGINLGSSSYGILTSFKTTSWLGSE